MSQITQFIGCDVSAETLHVAQFKNNTWQYSQENNTWETIQTYVQNLVKEQEKAGFVYHFIIEATGTYSTKLVYALCQAHVMVSLISPLQSRAFAKMRNKITKNDKTDSQLLAEYGQVNQADLTLYRLPEEPYVALRQLLDLLDQVEKLRRQVLNQSLAYAQLPPAQQKAFIQAKYQENIAQFTGQIVQIEAEIAQIKPPDTDLAEHQTLLKSIVGFGDKTVNTLLAYTGGLTQFENAKQLAKFIGISPTEYQSGSSIKAKGHINRAGNATIRRMLYVASWSAIRFNKACKQLYTRLRSKGKPAKLALIAVCNLLIRQAFAVIKKKCLFDNDYFEKNFASQTTF